MNFRRLPGADPPATLVVSKAALAQAFADASFAFPRETGGILLGWREPDAIVVVRLLKVTDPESGCASYTRIHAYAESALLEAIAVMDPGDPVGYVGEWHSHPALQGPSRRDRRELRAVARRTEHPVALIVVAYDPVADRWTPTGLTAKSCWTRTATVIEENAA